MSLSTVLKTIGKDLSHVGGWIDDGLKVAIEVAGVVDPPLGAIFTEVDRVLELALGAASPGQTPATMSAIGLQAIVQAVALLESLKVIPVPPPATGPPATNL